MIITFLYILMIAINLLLGLYKYKSKTVCFFSIFLIGVVFACGSHTSGDRLYYYTTYTEYTAFSFDDNYEIAYQLLMLLCRTFHLSFRAFLCVIFVINTVFISFALKKLTKNYHIVICCYSLFLVIYFSVVIRFSIAACIAFFAITKLLDNKRLSFLFWVIVAILFHNFAVFVLVLYFANPNNPRNRLVSKIVRNISVILTVVLVFANEFSSYLETFLIRVLPWAEYKITYYFQEERADWGLVIFCSFQFANAFFAHATQKHIQALFPNNENEELTKLSNMSYLGNSLLFISLPLIVINMNCLRMPMVMTLFNIAILSRIMFVKGEVTTGIKTNRYRHWFSIASVLQLLVWFVGIIVLHTNSIYMIDMLKNVRI